MHGMKLKQHHQQNINLETSISNEDSQNLDELAEKDFQKRKAEWQSKEQTN